MGAMEGDAVAVPLTSGDPAISRDLSKLDPAPLKGKAIAHAMPTIEIGQATVRATPGPDPTNQRASSVGPAIAIAIQRCSVLWSDHRKGTMKLSANNTNDMNGR